MASSRLVDRDAARWLVREDNPVEWLEVVLLAAALAACIAMTRSLPRHAAPAALLATGMVALAILEELSWGQRVLGYRTPDVVREINVQEQLTLHNLPVLNRRRMSAGRLCCGARDRANRRADPGGCRVYVRTRRLAERAGFWSGRFTEIGELAVAAAAAASAWATLERVSSGAGGPRAGTPRVTIERRRDEPIGIVSSRRSTGIPVAGLVASTNRASIL